MVWGLQLTLAISIQENPLDFPASMIAISILIDSFFIRL